MNREETVTVNENVDTEKRGRIIVFSLLLTLSMFIVKVSQTWDVNEVWILYLVAALYMLITFFGLVWVFAFQIKIKSIPCLAQSYMDRDIHFFFDV